MGPRDHGWRRRARLMLRHAWLLATGTVLLFVGLTVGIYYIASLPVTLKFAVAAPNNEDVKLVQAIAQQFNRDRAGIKLQTIVQDDPIQTAATIDSGKADLAIVRRDVAMPKSGLAVAVLRQNVVVMIVPAVGSLASPAPAKESAPATDATAKPAAKGAADKSKVAKPAKKGKPDQAGATAASEKDDDKVDANKIDKINQLAGRRIGLIGRGVNTANIGVLNVVLSQYEIAPGKVTIVPLDADNVTGSLKGRPVDVIFAVGPVTSRFISEAIAAASTATEPPTFLDIGASEAIANRLPVFESVELKAGVFGGTKPLPEETVETIGFNHYIVARKSVSDGTITEFTKLLFGVRQSLALDYPAITKLEKPDTDKDAAVPAHPGAAAFIDNDQKTFFDRYSDMLYWGLMLMSFFGAGISWLTSYSKADDRLRGMRVLDHLIDVIKRARAAEQFAEIEQLRADVDDILKRTLQQVEKNDLDETALMAFSLALDQAQLAISDRRAVLLARHNMEVPSEIPPLRIASP